ncbi:MAG: M28 family peptidase [Candidatus Odinarchaeota archaeon]
MPVSTVFKALERVNVHTAESNGKFIVEDRRNVIRELQTSLHKIEDSDYLLVYGTGERVNRDALLFSVHIDTVFDEIEHGVMKFPDGTITGTLDNTISIAAIIEASKYPLFSNNLPVYVSYTGGEEQETMLGARETIRYFQNQDIPVKCTVVLDITAEHYERDFSIENYLVKQNDFVKSITRYYHEKRLDPGFVSPEQALPDETWIYRYWSETFSLCLPVSSGVESMHQKDCRTNIKKLEALVKVLTLLPAYIAEFL